MIRFIKKFGYYTARVLFVIWIVLAVVGLVGVSFRWWNFSDAIQYYAAWIGLAITTGIMYLYIDVDV